MCVGVCVFVFVWDVGFGMIIFMRVSEREKVRHTVTEIESDWVSVHACLLVCVRACVDACDLFMSVLVAWKLALEMLTYKRQHVQQTMRRCCTDHSGLTVSSSQAPGR